MKVYIFGNGNIKFSEFEVLYLKPLQELVFNKGVEFIVCDFRGVDTLIMEYLKSETPNVTVLHIGEQPRYIPDRYRTKVSQWKVIGSFEDDEARDRYAIENCTHFIAKDFNSSPKRKSGTQKNIELCLTLGKEQIE
ncbi:hypothetical protein [Flammeovirga sp. SJP92]|uniref:hypothetical protein n=1 Tax=Flammeovirga sp. SJP92 TaxID=1775430 RepID=UPI000786BF0D|nr:hypothetical protein [Flammeovirga sp. SJP92]KXX71177.1 hypothetical protein AVL50_09840 [Flammeovirga sp. SJP92]